jgi:hypothetical protein
MSRENHKLFEILEGEFARLRREKVGDFRTLRQMAKHLGVDASLLSRYKIGDRPVSHSWAEKFALQLRPDDDTARRALADSIFAAKPPREDGELEVANWFGEHGHKGFLMLVEFFEPPVLQARTELSEDVAAAIVRGMCYGIICPFSEQEATNIKLPLPLRTYLQRVWDDILTLYSLLLELAFENIVDNWPESRDRGERRKELNDCAERLRVYRAIDGDVSVLPAIGHRLFFCQDHSNPNHPGKPEFWQWNTTAVGERMLKRRAEAFELEAIESLLYPIPQWFQEQAQQEEYVLPKDNQLEMHYQANRHRLRPGGQFPASRRWGLVEDQAKIDEEIDSALGEKDNVRS